MPIDQIAENFALLDEWDDRYRYVIELGRTLAPFPEAARTEANKVLGCASQVWLITQIDRTVPRAPVLRFTGDSDAHIVARPDRHSAGDLFRQIRAGDSDTDALAQFDRLGLRENLTPQRSNGLKSMVGRIRDAARGALADADH